MPSPYCRICTLINFRPVYLVRLDRPLVWLSDEPVVIDGDDTDRHHPDCFLTSKQLRRRARKSKSGECRTVIHIRPYRRHGILDADAVVIPLAPDAVLAYGPPMDGVDLAIRDEALSGADATTFAEELNASIAASALDVIVGPPDDHGFPDRAMPESSPILLVCGPKTVASAALNEPLRRVRPTRFLNHARWSQ